MAKRSRRNLRVFVLKHYAVCLRIQKHCVRASGKDGSAYGKFKWYLYRSMRCPLAQCRGAAKERKHDSCQNDKSFHKTSFRLYRRLKRNEPNSNAKEETDSFGSNPLQKNLLSS